MMFIKSVPESQKCRAEAGSDYRGGLSAVRGRTAHWETISRQYKKSHKHTNAHTHKHRVWTFRQFCGSLLHLELSSVSLFVHSCFISWSGSSHWKFTACVWVHNQVQPSFRHRAAAAALFVLCAYSGPPLETFSSSNNKHCSLHAGAETSYRATGFCCTALHLLLCLAGEVTVKKPAVCSAEMKSRSRNWGGPQQVKHRAVNLIKQSPALGSLHQDIWSLPHGSAFLTIKSEKSQLFFTDRMLRRLIKCSHQLYPTLNWT